MKLLGLLRHAKSDWDDMSLRDFDRGLNARGRKGAALMGKHLKAHGVKWERLLASPAERVQRTLEASGIGVTPEFHKELYLADTDGLIATIRKHGGDTDALLVAAHNPGLQELALDLVAPTSENDIFAEVMVKYPTASFAVLELDIDNWSQVRAGCGKLVHFARPRDLDPELGPEKVIQ